MLNKNDPLIGAVQEVMKRNHAEREAARLVNEKFGVQDRKALPHEKQSAWDSAYKQVLSEDLHPNQQKLDVHEPEKDKLTKHDFKMLRAKKKTMEEAKVNPYAVGMAAVKKSTGDEPPMEKKNITKAHKIAKKIIAKKKMNEGFNNRHSLSENASAEKQAVADQLKEEESYDPAKEARNRFTRLSGARKGSDVRKKISGELRLRRMGREQKAKGIGLNAEPGNYRVNKALDQAKAFASGAVGYGSDYEKFYPRAAETGKLAGIGSMLIPGRPAVAAGQTAMRASAVPKIAASGPRGRMPLKGPWGKAPVGQKVVQGAPRVSAPSGTFAANLQKARQQAQNARVGGSTVQATQKATNLQKAQQSSQALGGFSKVPAGKKNVVQRVLDTKVSKTTGQNISRGLTGLGVGLAAGGAAYTSGQFSNNSPPPAAAKPSKPIQDRVPQEQPAAAAPQNTSQAAAKAPTSYTAQKGSTVWDIAKQNIRDKRAQAVASVPDAGQGEISRARAMDVSNKDIANRTNQLLKANQMTQQSARKMQIGKVIKAD